MTLGEKMKMLRMQKCLSQERLAEQLGVSRQAVTKWEADQTTPSADHLIALAGLYEVSLDMLVNTSHTEHEEYKNTPKYNPILRANLTRIAIICQAAFLNAAIQENPFLGSPLWMILTVLPLLFSSIWMVWNLRYEKEKKQRKKNTQIELLYCLLQWAIALFGFYTKHYFPTAASLITVCLVYILYVNPKYMNRQLVRKRKNKV